MSQTPSLNQDDKEDEREREKKTMAMNVSRPQRKRRDQRLISPCRPKRKEDQKERDAAHRMRLQTSAKKVMKSAKRPDDEDGR